MDNLITFRHDEAHSEYDSLSRLAGKLGRALYHSPERIKSRFEALIERVDTVDGSGVHLQYSLFVPKAPLSALRIAFYPILGSEVRYTVSREMSSDVIVVDDTRFHPVCISQYSGWEKLDLYSTSRGVPHMQSHFMFERNPFSEELPYLGCIDTAGLHESVDPDVLTRRIRERALKLGCSESKLRSFA